MYQDNGTPDTLLGIRSRYFPLGNKEAQSQWWHILGTRYHRPWWENGWYSEGPLTLGFLKTSTKSDISLQNVQILPVELLPARARVILWDPGWDPRVLPHLLSR